MSAIRNVGELASPYYLLEVWARREEIDIDPETYASLKRKARTLVRDSRAFEARGEQPDDDWRSRRRELLGIEDAIAKTFVLDDGTEVDLLIWRDTDAADSLLVGDLPGFADPDRRPQDAADPPSTAFELALDAYEGEADWGLLLAGLEIRAYRRSSGISQQYLALDLDTLVELDDEAAWKAFAAIFRAPSFSSARGVPLIRRVVDESRRHATALADDMRADVVDAAEALTQGVLDHRANERITGEPTREVRHRLFEQGLYYLYRILFVLYSESRDVLPVSGGTAYATTYSVDHLVELARTEPEAAEGTYYGETLRRLFGFLWSGPEDVARSLDVEPVGGELFDPSHTELLDRCVISDVYWRRALTSIALGAPGSPRRRLGRRQSFAELGVDQLGSIYEGLLVLEPTLVPGPRVLVLVDGERRALEETEAEGLRVLRHLDEGDFVLESASGRRKGSGSFYTPAEITEYLAHAALDPLTEPIVARAADDSAAAELEILALRVCDPAMGSGAFLVQAARALGTALARVRAARADGRVTPEMIQQAKREVVRRCIYGVDLNPLAVVLAKVSLWLETLERGRPLSFLDAHLRCGDSLVGLEFQVNGGGLSAAELATWPKDADKGLKTYLRKEAGKPGEPVLERLKKRKGPRDLHQATLPLDVSGIERALAAIAGARAELVRGENGEETLQLTLDVAKAFDELETAEDSVRNRLRAAADVWCAQWFSDGEDGPSDDEGPVVPLGVSDYETIVRCLLQGEEMAKRLQPTLEAARVVGRKRRFFHWALEFPEVIIERGGFDAVIGNPPWNTLSPDTKEFFSTYDLKTFRKGVPKKEQDARKQELRSDPEIDAAWRREARFLHELSYWAKPDAGRFKWFAPNPQLRKGDANVYRLFVERGYRILREGGRLGQVLPDSVYVSSPATGVRQHLIEHGQLERCYVFENRRKIFPIDSRIKVVLLIAKRGGGSTKRFKAKFYVGKNPVGGDRSVGLEELPEVLAELDREAPELSVDQVRALAPETWAFPELQTALDAEIVAQCASRLPALNLDDRGWGLTFCRELDADKDAWRFHEAADLEARGAVSKDLWYVEPDGTEWWPLVEGHLFYNLEFPAEGKEPKYWVKGPDVRSIEGRLNSDGSSVMEHYRVAWRDVARSVDERSAIATVIPPRTAAKHTSPTAWGGALPADRVLALAALMSSIPFDFLVRLLGKGHLTYGALNAVPAPSFDLLSEVVPFAAEVVYQSEPFADLWKQVSRKKASPALDAWGIGQRRAAIDAKVALAYGLSLEQYAAALCTFPNLDRTQAMLPGEPKSFVTRDLALLAYCDATGTKPPDIGKLMRKIGVDLPDPKPEYRLLRDRVSAARELGAVPYRPTPRGGRPPTDPALVEDVTQLLSSDPMTTAEIAEALEEEEKTIQAVLKELVRQREAYAEGRGKGRRYYVIEEDE